MRIAVFGVGGVGGYFGGRLAESGKWVGFVARGPHLQALRRDGLKVESAAGDFQVRPAAADDDPAAIGPVDVVLLAVKAWQVTDAARAMGPLLGPRTIVLPIQNGVEAADQVDRILGPGRALPGLCRLVSYVVGPGHIRHAGVDPLLEFGERDGRRTERVLALQAFLEKVRGFSVSVPDDIEAAIWEKFLFIAPVGAVGAATRKPFGVVRRVAEARALLEAAIREVAALARARGVRIRADAVERTLAYFDGLPEDGSASMQRDILEGRPSELDDQTGAVVRLARAAGVPVPVNESLYGALLPAELQARGRLPE